MKVAAPGIGEKYKPLECGRGGSLSSLIDPLTFSSNLLFKNPLFLIISSSQNPVFSNDLINSLQTHHKDRLIRTYSSLKIILLVFMNVL